MNTYAQVLTYAIPGFVVLILLEYLASKWMKKDVANSMDTISSLSSGMTNTLKDIIGIAIVIVSYGWMTEHFALFAIQSNLWLYFLCFILVDFASYWSHRFNHEINLMWNRHIIHHSSEEFNLSCALRQSISGIVGVYFFLYIPMAIVGIPAKVVAIVAPLHLFAQFWYHTRLIGRMGFLEQILVTPSHHRVHHAINEEYIDKNFAAILIIWDKLFGTFKEEDPDIEPVYGVKKPVRTWNPFLINYQHMVRLIKDAWRTKKWSDKLKIWIMPTGWRPKDVSDKYPISVIDDVYAYRKYQPQTPSGLKMWSWCQLLIHNGLMYLMLINIDNMNPYSLGLYAFFLAVSIFAYTSLMDTHKLAIPSEIAKVCLGVFILLKYEGWFGMSQEYNFLDFLIPIYLVLSIGASVFFIVKSASTKTHNESEMQDSLLVS